MDGTTEQATAESSTSKAAESHGQSELTAKLKAMAIHEDALLVRNSQVKKMVAWALVHKMTNRVGWQIHQTIDLKFPCVPRRFLSNWLPSDRSGGVLLRSTWSLLTSAQMRESLQQLPTRSESADYVSRG